MQFFVCLWCMFLFDLKLLNLAQQPSVEVTVMTVDYSMFCVSVCAIFQTLHCICVTSNTWSCPKECWFPWLVSHNYLSSFPVVYISVCFCQLLSRLRLLTDSGCRLVQSALMSRKTTKSRHHTSMSRHEQLLWLCVVCCVFIVYFSHPLLMHGLCCPRMSII